MNISALSLGFPSLLCSTLAATSAGNLNISEPQTSLGALTPRPAPFSSPPRPPSTLWRLPDFLERIQSASPELRSATPFLLLSAAGALLALSGRWKEAMDILLVASLAVTAMNSGSGNSVFPDERKTGVFPSGMGPEDPDDPENENNTNTVQNTALLLQNHMPGSDYADTLCRELPWLSPEEMRQAMREAVTSTPPERVIGNLELAISQTERNDDNHRLLLLQLIGASYSLTQYPKDDFARLLGHLARRLSIDGARDKAWEEFDGQLRTALASWDGRDTEGLERVNETAMHIRASAWRTGFRAPAIDTVINLASRSPSEMDSLSKSSLYSVSQTVRNLAKNGNLVRFFLEIQYVSDRIAAAGDLVRAKLILSEAIEDIKKRAQSIHQAEASYLIARLKTLHDGIMSVLLLMTNPDTQSLRQIIAIYRSPDYATMPPIHVLVRRMRHRADELFRKKKIDVLRFNEIGEACADLVTFRILDSILGERRTDEDAALSRLRSQLFNALSRGSDADAEEWAALLSETTGFLMANDRFEAAHDFLRAFYKLGLCDARVFSGLAMGIVTSMENVIRTGDKARMKRCELVRNRLVEWLGTFDVI